MDEESAHIIFQQLPNTDTVDNAGAYIKDILSQQLPKSDQQNLERELRWDYVLDKRADKKKKKRPVRKRKTYLTRNERKELNLLKLSRDGWNYDSLQTIRNMWKGYMKENLELIEIPQQTEADYQSLNLLLAKSEYIGAEIKVIRSTCPSVIDLEGTVVLETKNTFQIVTKESKLKIILKENSVFEIVLNNIRFTIFGKLLLTKPAERSVKKIKSFLLPDL